MAFYKASNGTTEYKTMTKSLGGWISTQSTATWRYTETDPHKQIVGIAGYNGSYNLGMISMGWSSNSCYVTVWHGDEGDYGCSITLKYIEV